MSKTNSNGKFNAFTLTQLALFSALIVVMSFVPYTGIISYGVISITTLHIPVIIGSVLLGWKNGAFLGLVMGVCSLIRAWLMPGSPLEQIIFMNPIVSVLPRIFIGLFAGLIYAGMIKLTKGKQAFSIGAAALTGSLTNTVFVLLLMNLLYYQKLSATFGGTLLTIVSTIFSLNGAIEILGAVIISIPIAMALLKVKDRLHA